MQFRIIDYAYFQQVATAISLVSLTSHREVYQWVELQTHSLASYFVIYCPTCAICISLFLGRGGYHPSEFKQQSQDKVYRHFKELKSYM